MAPCRRLDESFIAPCQSPLVKRRVAASVLRHLKFICISKRCLRDSIPQGMLNFMSLPVTSCALRYRAWRVMKRTAPMGPGC